MVTGMQNQNKELPGSVKAMDALNTASNTRADQSHPYVFARGYVDTTRLVANHYIWQAHLRYLIHPSIPSSTTWRVADVAAGACAWSLDVAEEHPSASVTCLDISSEQAPHLDCLPNNASWRKWDIFSLPSDDLKESFDVVHVRLICTLVENGDPSTVIRQLAMLLKPGGYLQWEDLDPSTTSTTVADSDPTARIGSYSCLDELLKNSMMWTHQKWIRDLPERLEKNGFEGAKDYSVMPKAEYGKMMTAGFLTGWEERAMRMEDDKVRTKWMEVIEGAGKEMNEEGLGMVYGIKVVVGRKADKSTRDDV